MTDESICPVGKSMMLTSGVLVGFVVKLTTGEIDGSDVVVLSVGEEVGSDVVGIKVDGKSVWFKVGADDSEAVGGKVSNVVGVPVVVFVVGAGEGAVVGISVEIGAGTGIKVGSVTGAGTGAITGAVTGTGVGGGIGAARGEEEGALDTVGKSEGAEKLAVGWKEIDGNVDGKSETVGSIVGSTNKLADGSRVSVTLGVGIKVADDSGVGMSVAKG